MIKRQSPTITQANIMFFITAVITLAGSAFFQPRLGTGINLWINEYVYILFPPLLMAWINGWPVEKVYRFRKISARSKIISILSALTIWPLASAVSLIIRKFLDDKIGVLNSPGSASSSVYQNLLIIIGMVILAPVCEEILFRGFIQSAYESRSKKYGFVIAALIFGAYHILNGISEVIPASILGFAWAFLHIRQARCVVHALPCNRKHMRHIVRRSAYNQHAGSNLVWLCAAAVAGAFFRSPF